MPTFLCSRCGAVENTATSHYCRNILEKRAPICSKCDTGT